MSGFQLSLLVAAAFVSIISSRLPRATLWIFAGGVNFIASTAWWRYGLPYPPAFTMALDSVMCLAIYFFCKEIWEERLFRVFQLSVLCSLVFLAGPISILGITIVMSHHIYIISLELCNWGALVIIATPTIIDMAKHYEIDTNLRWGHNVRNSHSSWRAARKQAPFHHKIR